MKSLIKNILINTFLFYLLATYIEGVSVDGGFGSYFSSALILTAVTIIIDPIIKLLTVPFTLLTLGLFSFIPTLVALYITTIIYEPLKIGAFTFDGLSLYGLEIEKVDLSAFLSFVFVSATIYFLNRAVNWLFRT